MQQGLVKCVERAARFIASELSQERVPDLDAIAGASGVSKFHFHRVYRLVTGETCHQTITRLRLAQGASALQDGSVSVTEAAMMAGYASSQAFAKAMKRELKTTASALKADPERLSSAVALLSVPGGEQGGVAVTLCAVDGFKVRVIETSGLYLELVGTYGLLFELAGGPDNVRAVLGRPHQDMEEYLASDFAFDCLLQPGDEAFTDHARVQEGEVSGGHYASTRHVGPDSELPETLDRLYTQILMQEGVMFADAPCLMHYIDDPEEVAEDKLRTDVYVEIIPAGESAL